MNMTTRVRARVGTVRDTPQVSGDEQPCQDEKRSQSWVGKVLCKIGAHAGEWQYIGPGNCNQTHQCQRCAKTRLRTRHIREWLYTVEGSCGQVRTCTRCLAESGERLKHQWSEATYSGNEGTRRCDRCGEIRTWTVSG